MLSEGDWGAHETHPNDEASLKLIGEVDPSLYLMAGWMLSEVDRGGHDQRIYHMDGSILSEVDWGGHDSSPYHMNSFLLSEVDWRAHDSSYFP